VQDDVFGAVMKLYLDEAPMEEIVEELSKRLGTYILLWETEGEDIFNWSSNGSKATLIGILNVISKKYTQELIEGVNQMEMDGSGE